MLYFAVIVDLCHLSIRKEPGREKNKSTMLRLINLINYFWTLANNVNPERTPHLAASDQDLHNLLAEISICT